MSQQIGWWLFDNEAIAMFNSRTAQTVRFKGVASSDDRIALTSSKNRMWLRFDYEDREALYPLLVEWRNVPARGRPVIWRLDHDRSARLWRQQTGSDAPFPGYGLWRRVDDCAIDAFSCWPAHPSTGAHPERVVVNSGWLNGAWTVSFYRAVASTLPLYWPTDLDQEFPALPALDSPPPAPWLFIDALDRMGSATIEQASWASNPACINRDLNRLTRSRPHLQTQDGAQMLLGLPRIEGIDPEAHRRPPDYRARLLYADSEFITDTMIADIGCKPGPGPWELCVSEKGDFGSGLVSRTTGTPIRLIEQKIELPPPNAPSFTLRRTPNLVMRRLAQSLIDARLSHSDLGVDFAPRTDDANAFIPAGEPKTIEVVIPLAGALTAKMCAGTSLSDSQYSDLGTFMFDEQRDGVIRASTSFKTYGYWAYDPETKSLVNQMSDQRVQVLHECRREGGDKIKPEAHGGKVWLFRYSDASVEYPVVVHTSEHGDFYRWHIDHDRSRWLWRDQGNGPASPGYGLWRRVESSVFDALLCWPEIETTGPVPNFIHSHAGWSNAAWNPQLLRIGQKVEDFDFDPPPQQPEAPYIEALDTPAPSWTFVDAAEIAGRADLDHVQEIASGRLYLPQDCALAGFESKMPHLRRNDGKAVIFPAGQKGSFFKHDSTRIWFVYADEDVFFYFAGSAWRFEWSFNLSCIDFTKCVGLRKLERFDPDQPGGLPSDLFLQWEWPSPIGDYSVPKRNPSPALAQRISTALLDAGLAWNRQICTVNETPELIMRYARIVHEFNHVQEVVIERSRNISVEGGYVGGRYKPNFKLCQSQAK